MIKRGNVDKKCEHLKVNISRIKKILKFYIETNPEYKKLYESGEIKLTLDLFNDNNEDEFLKHIDKDGF